MVHSACKKGRGNLKKTMHTVKERIEKFCCIRYNGVTYKSIMQEEKKL